MPSWWKKKLLRWDSTLAELFPDQATQFPEAVRGITVDQLLRHRSGLPANLSWWSYGSGEPAAERRRQVVAALAKVKPRFTPGSSLEYSNLGYVILGAVVDALAGRPWEEQLRSALFEPLGMTGMGLGGSGTPGLIDQPWPHKTNGSPMDRNGPTTDNPPVMAPAGGVHGPLSSWALFVEDFMKGLQGSGKLLSRESYEHLARPAPGADMACGWLSLNRKWGGRVLTHAGSNTMNYAVAWLAPEKGFAVLVVCNQAGEGAEKATDDLASALIMRAVR